MNIVLPGKSIAKYLIFLLQLGLDNDAPYFPVFLVPAEVHLPSRRCATIDKVGLFVMLCFRLLTFYKQQASFEDSHYLIFNQLDGKPKHFKSTAGDGKFGASMKSDRVGISPSDDRWDLKENSTGYKECSSPLKHPAVFQENPSRPVSPPFEMYAGFQLYRLRSLVQLSKPRRAYCGNQLFIYWINYLKGKINVNARCWLSPAPSNLAAFIRS